MYRKMMALKYLLGKYHRENCPSEFYQAWKVLILKTTEYEIEDAFCILSHAVENIEELRNMARVERFVNGK